MTISRCSINKCDIIKVRVYIVIKFSSFENGECFLPNVSTFK